MPITSAALQLALEKPLKDFIESQNIFPDDYDFHCAHDLETPASKNYLDIIADLPVWQGVRASFADVRVTFQVCTDVSDPEKRADQTAVHQEYLGDLMELFMDKTFFDVRDAVNALATGIAIIGWAVAPALDGQNKESKQIAPTLVYDLRIYRK